MIPRSLKLKVFAGLLLVFGLGGATGAAVMRSIDNQRLLDLFEKGPVQTRREIVLLELEQRLKLTPSQREEVSAILDAQVTENAATLRLFFVPMMMKYWNNVSARMKPSLDESQQRELETWIKERQTNIERGLGAPL